MPRDAFGNETNDDPLAGISSYSSGSSPQGVPGGGPRRNRGAAVALLTVAVLVIASAAGAVLLALSAGEDESERPTTTPAAETTASADPSASDPDPDPLPEREAKAEPDPEPAVPTPAEPTAPPSPPTGLQPGSLLRRANFTVALRRLRAEAKGRPRNLRVEAARVDVQLLLNDGRLRSAQASWDGEVRVFSTTPTPIGVRDAYDWSAIDRGAPQRIVRSATGRARKPASAFNYAVLLDAVGLRWSAFLKDGTGFSATSAGTVERQIGG